MYENIGFLQFRTVVPEVEKQVGAVVVTAAGQGAALRGLPQWKMSWESRMTKVAQESFVESRARPAPPVVCVHK